MTRRLAETPDRVIDCHAVSCKHCGTAVDKDRQRVRQAYDPIELPPVRPVVTRVRIFGARCAGCNRRVRGEAPTDMPPGSPFGLTIMVMLAYLHHQHAIAYERLVMLMRELFGLTISQGAIANALRRCQPALAKAEQAILAHLREAQTICSDETSARLGGSTAWEWVFACAKAVLHKIVSSRGAQVVREGLAGHRPQTTVSDRWSGQLGHGERQQICLAHVLRDVQYAIDCGDTVFAPGLKTLLRWATRVGRRRSTLKDSTLKAYRLKADSRLDRLLAQNPSHPQGQALRVQTKKWRHAFFIFLEDRTVPATNNVSERALRPSVVHRKVTNCFRSVWGANVHAQIRSVIDTGRLAGTAAFQSITAVLKGLPLTEPEPIPEQLRRSQGVMAHLPR